MEREDGSFRKLRKSFNIPGQAHELTFSCYKRLPLLCKDRTRKWFIESLQRARHRWKFELWGYVIMPEHAHVLLIPRNDDYDISQIIKAIKLSVARKALDYLRSHHPSGSIAWPFPHPRPRSSIDSGKRAAGTIETSIARRQLGIRWNTSTTIAYEEAWSQSY